MTRAHVTPLLRTPEGLTSHLIQIKTQNPSNGLCPRLPTPLLPTPSDLIIPCHSPCGSPSCQLATAGMSLPSTPCWTLSGRLLSPQPTHKPHSSLPHSFCSKTPSQGGPPWPRNSELQTALPTHFSAYLFSLLLSPTIRLQHL